MDQLLDDLSRRNKRLLAIITDLIMLPVALWTAFALRLESWNPEVAQFWPAFVLAALVAVPVFLRLGLYRQIIRYMGNYAMLAVVKGTVVAALAVGAACFFFQYQPGIFPRSVPIIFWMLALLYVGGSRFIIRGYVQSRHRGKTRQPVIIYGAGSRGVELAHLLLQQDDYLPIAFLDDNRKLQRSSIDGIFVYAPQALGQLLRDSNVKQVFVAVSKDAQGRRSIIEFLENFSVHVRLIPEIGDLLSGRTSLANVRDVGIEDLLGRDEVEGLPHLLEGGVSERVVMVTGAGGSIGSELCRQILRQKPTLLVMLDQSEYALYEVLRELGALNTAADQAVPLAAVLGSVNDAALLRQTFNRYNVQAVYHAAAYKHVTMVEENIIQGLKNNTFGTQTCAETALACGVEDFILISTDKAVRTTSVMGASKRLAEIILQALQERSETTRFSMVRFGNVLGSSGSVVPLFTEQIDQGGPVTVTHPEVTRYFMSIPEAAQLVLQAASMAQGGDVFLLDMGKPVKILDLAHRMIRLKGFAVKNDLNPQGDIGIEFTGLRHGEKLHEELLVGDDVTGTDHRKIMRAEESYISWHQLRGGLRHLEDACDQYDHEVVKSFVNGLIKGADLEEQLDRLAPRADVVTLQSVRVETDPKPPPTSA